MKVAGFVLVGGTSSRMGKDKALLRLGSRYLVEYVAEAVAAAAGSVALVGSPDRYRNLPYALVSDLHSGLGPMAGIEAALESGRGELSLIVACDMPGLNANHLSQLLYHARKSRALCVATQDAAGLVHPLCAVYRSACLPVIKRTIADRHLRLMDLLGSLGPEFFRASVSIENVNTPDEWAGWQKTGGLPFSNLPIPS